MEEEDYFPDTKVQTKIKYRLQDQSQNIGLDLATYVQKIMS